ncbi:MAG: hypothetical protein H8E40_00130 [Chloroflexi bacterium]|nr:hypothetical protein [Chloroflexota bacterium]
MNSCFWNDFFVNFLADLLAGAVLALVLALPLNLWVDRKLNELARIQQRKEEKRAKLEKAIRYLEHLNPEIDYLLNELPSMINTFEGMINAFEGAGWQREREARIPTPLWDVLQPSGELPRLLDPDLLEALTRFYDHLMYAKRGQDFVIDSWASTQKARLSWTLSALKQALQSGRDLPHRIDLEIQACKTELQAI